MWPVGRALVKGTVEGPYLVGVGKDVYIEMDDEQYEEYQKKHPAASEAKREEDEIREELTAQDMELLEARSRPRVAHVLTSMKRLETGPVKSQVIERTGSSQVIERAGSSQVIERIGPSEIPNPVQTTTRESIFKQRSAMSKGSKLDEQ